MKQSQLFTKTRFEAPKDEVAKNAQILIRAGFVHKEMAGVYTYLPLGLRVIEKIKDIVREEMNELGGQELMMTALQSKDLWEKTNRWSDDVVDNWFKTKLKNDTELGLGFTHEEPITEMMKGHIRSYKDLPLYAYQFQTKFRNEARAKSGILRGREFLMKDMYSFCKNEADHLAFYEKVKDAYLNVFKRVGIGEQTCYTFASGGIFAKFSHEFQTETSAGEDLVYYNKENNIAINKEVFTDEVKKDLGLNGDFEEKKTVEVGNIFTLGTRFSLPLELNFVDESGQNQSVFMGSYGIGITRLMGVIVEKNADEKSMLWPESVSPFKVHLVELSQGDEAVKKSAEEIYEKLKSKGVEVLFDDRDARAGEKFADADLIGIPHRIVISKKTEALGTVEYLNRMTGETLQKTKEEIINLF